MLKTKRLRRAARLTQDALAQRARISRWRLAMAEAGHLVLNGRELSAIRRVFNREGQRFAQRLGRELKDAVAMQ